MFFWFFSSPGKKVSFFLLLFVLLLFVARTKHLSTSRPNKRRERERESRNKLTGAQHAVLADANVGPDLAPRADLGRGVDEDVALDRVVAAGAGERGRVLGAEGAEVELEACVADDCASLPFMGLATPEERIAAAGCDAQVVLAALSQAAAARP